MNKNLKFNFIHVVLDDTADCVPLEDGSSKHLSLPKESESTLLWTKEF